MNKSDLFKTTIAGIEKPNDWAVTVISPSVKADSEDISSARTLTQQQRERIRYVNLLLRENGLGVE